MTKTQFKEKIKRRLGYPLVKVELDDKTIGDHTDYARNKFIKWAAGNATQEVTFTTMLSGGQYLYPMPTGCLEIINFESNTSGSVNQLFTIPNQLYMAGVFDPIQMTDGYNLISYHLARDFIDTLRKYVFDIYNFKYHKYSNKLEIQPPPPTGNALSFTSNGTTYGPYDSPGWILLNSLMLEEATLPNFSGIDTEDLNMYGNDWILDYTTALCKVTLGMIRRKFANFTGVGNVGVALDGDQLVSEGREEILKLEEDLDEKESYIGYGIEIG